MVLAGAALLARNGDRRAPLAPGFPAGGKPAGLLPTWLPPHRLSIESTTRYAQQPEPARPRARGAGLRRGLRPPGRGEWQARRMLALATERSEEHTSELQSL